MNTSDFALWLFDKQYLLDFIIIMLVFRNKQALSSMLQSEDC